MTDFTNDLDFLLNKYEEKFGKRPVGKWAKDIEWLCKKLDLKAVKAEDRKVETVELTNEEELKIKEAIIKIEKPKNRYSLLFNGRYIVKDNKNNLSQAFPSKDAAETFINRHQ